MAFQQCGANAADMICQGTHDPMRPITNYVRVIDLTAPGVASHGSDEQHRAGGVDDADARNVLPAGHAAAGGRLATLGRLAGVLHHALGLPERRGGEQRDGEPPQGRRQELHRPDLESGGQGASGKSYVINGYVNDQNLVERVETWLGENIMGDMHILATYTGWKDFGGVHGAVEDRADARRLAVLRSRRDGGEGESSRCRDAGSCTGAGRPAVAAPAAADRGGGAPPALTVTSEKLGDGLYRLTTGPGSYDSVIVEFKDYVMMLEAGQSEARGLAYIAETKKLIPNKPIRYVMNTHPHSDHTGGLPALVAEGATIITQKNNEAFLEKALNTPRTLLNDTLAKNPKKAKIEAVVGEEGLLGRDAHRRAVPRLSGAALERPDDRVHPEGEGPVPGRLLAAGAGSAGQRSRQGAGADSREAQSGLRSLHQRAHLAAPQTKADLWKAVGK